MRAPDSRRRRGSWIATAPLFGVLLMAGGCACPPWTQTHADPRYPEARYLLGVGSSNKNDEKSRQDEAYAIGLREIAGRLGTVRISSEITEVTSVDQRGVERSEATEKIRQAESAKIPKPRPVDSCHCWNAGGRTFFLLVAAPNPGYHGPPGGDPPARPDRTGMALVIAGAAVIAAGIGLSAYGFNALAQSSDPDEPIDPAARDELDSRGTATALAGVAALNAGTGLLLGGAIQWALASRKQRTAWHVTGSMTPGGAVAGIGGSF